MLRIAFFVTSRPKKNMYCIFFLYQNANMYKNNKYVLKYVLKYVTNINKYFRIRHKKRI